MLLGSGLCQGYADEVEATVAKLFGTCRRRIGVAGARIRDRSAEGFATAAAQDMNLVGELF